MKKVLPAGAVRQALLLCAAIGLALLLPHSGSAQTFAKGADTGWLQQMEANGFPFYDDQGVAQDCFALLKAKGINSIRLRVWVNPSMTDWVNGHCSPSEVVTMAKRATNLGLRVMIDFHYSDSWADPGQQTKPAAWQNYTFTQLKQAVYDHTYNTMTALAAQGVYPEWVQVGNEIPGGMLWPEGKFSTNPGQLAQLINQGYAAMKAVSASSKVVIHLDRGNNNSLYRSFFDQLTTNGGKYDVIGMSFYPYWLKTTGTTTYAAGDYAPYIANLQTNLNDMVSRYGKEVIISEVGGDAALPQDTYNMLVAVQQAVKAVPNGKGLGVFYWEPEGYRNFSGYQLSAWGNDGKPTVAMNAFLHEFIPLTNPSFELNGAKATTLTGWSTYVYPTTSKPVYTETAGFIGTYRVTHYLATAYQASTYQVKTGLPNGTYTLSAWVKNGGSQKTCQLYAKNFGGAEMDYALPVTDAWTQIRLTGIPVSNGQLELGLWSDANAGNYASIDNVELFRTDITISNTSSLSARMTSAQATTQIAASLTADGQEDAGITLYPNPSAGDGPVRVALRGLAGCAVTVQVADLLGRVVARQQFTPGADYAETSVAVPAATPPGVYVLTAGDGTRTWTTRWSRQP